MKTKAIQTFLPLLLWSVFSGLNAQVITNGLVAYYPFTGNANDSSGNGHDGTTMNGTYLTSDRFGHSNSAYFFDGIDDFIEVPASSAFNFRTCLTFSAWINQNAPTIHGPRILDKHIANTPSGGFSYDTYGKGLDTNGRGHTIRFLNCRSGANWEGSNTAYSFNAWHHVAVTYNYGTIVYYLDGVVDFTMNDGTISLDSNNLTLRIGTSHMSTTEYFSGKIDDIYIFDCALTSTEIVDLYHDSLSISTIDSLSTIAYISEPVEIIPSNIFTPNNDGKNDVFYFKNLEFFPNTKLEVFNRWGNKVYENSNYQNDWKGGNLSDGVYYFILKVSEKQTKKGTVTIKR